MRSGAGNSGRLTQGGAEVIICVHDALDDVRRCLASVMTHTDHSHRLILVDDASGPECRGALERFAGARPATTLLQNAERRGYTHSANRGLRESSANFVILLNSDTIVTAKWLERLQECAASDERIGVVGPLSNAATFQSVPERFDSDNTWARNPLPAGWAPDDVAAHVARVAPRTFPRVGMLNGFCFGITRTVIDAIGFFDEEVFPDAYGEEQDYCLRASRAGFELAVADHAYVYHAKGRSHGSLWQQELKEPGTAALVRKHGNKRVRKAFEKTYDDPTLAALRDQIARALREALPLCAPPRHGMKTIDAEQLRCPEVQVAREYRVVKNRDSRSWVSSEAENLSLPKPVTRVGSPADRLLGSFIHEIDMQCAWAELAYSSLVMALNDRDANGFRGRSQHQRIFFYLHAFLTHTAIISSMLWPSDGVLDKDLERLGMEMAEQLLPIRQERGKRLRKALGIKKSSLLMDERLRDFLQHYDARVELWGMSGPVGQDLVISSTGAKRSKETCQEVRRFDPVTMIFSMQCDDFELPAFAMELARLHRSVARQNTIE